MKRALLLVLTLLTVTGCSGAPPAPDTASRSARAYQLSLGSCPAPGSSASAGDVLPALSFPCLTGGQDMVLGRTSRTPAVLNLWAPWCAPCRDELPLFDRMHAEAGDLIGVSGLVEKDTMDSSLAYAAETQLSFPSALDQTGKLLYDQGLNGLPATFFLRADGSIAHRQIGPIASYDELRALVAEHLGVTVP